MQFVDIQKEVVKNALAYGQRYDIAIDRDFIVKKIFEEVGELAQAVLVHEEKCRTNKRVSEEVSRDALAQEMADVLGMVMVAAHLYNIDVEHALDAKWINNGKIK